MIFIAWLLGAYITYFLLRLVATFKLDDGEQRIFVPIILSISITWVVSIPLLLATSLIAAMFMTLNQLTEKAIKTIHARMKKD